MATRDNWGWRARIGMFIVGNEAVPEAEWWAMLPPDVSVHAARVSAAAPWASWHAERTGVDLDSCLRLRFVPNGWRVVGWFPRSQAGGGNA